MKPLYQLIQECESKYNEQKAIFDACDADAIVNEKGDSEPRPVTSDELARLKTLSSEISELEKQIADHKQADAIRDRVSAKAASVPASPSIPAANPRRKSVGEKFVESDEWKAFAKSIAGTQKGIKSPAVVLDGVGLKALVTSQDTNDVSVAHPDRYQPWDFAGWFQPISVLDIISTVATSSDNVSFVRVHDYTPGAEPTAEATSTSTGGTGLKPEAAVELEVVNAPVQSIPHWIPVTRRALDDNAQMRGMIDALLVNGVRAALENQVLNGNGTGVEFDGMYSQNIQTVTFSDTMLDTARLARTAIRLSQIAGGGGAQPTAYVMHPNDWARFELAKNEIEDYYGGGPFGVAPARLWGLPVVESEFAQEGQPLIGDWRLALLFDRQAPTMYVTDSHADFFAKNILAILAELRAAFGVQRPSAFAKFQMVAPTT
jgi:HK97 family phage major capsid protein